MILDASWWQLWLAWKRSRSYTCAPEMIGTMSSRRQRCAPGRSRRQFRGDSKFTSWVHTIVRNVVLDGHRRKHARRRPIEVSMPDFFDAVDEKLSPVPEDWHKVEELLPTLNGEM